MMLVFFTFKLRIFINPNNYKLITVRDIYIKHILAQCNRPKPSPACTSSLGFSRLYILMLGFIVT